MIKPIGNKEVLDLKEGCKVTFEQIFHDYFPRLVNFAYSYISDWEEARNIAQEVLLTLWRKREELDDHSNINGYLLTLTRNQCLNYLKSFHHKVRRSAELELNQQALQHIDENWLTFQELEDAIQAAIDSLPAQCRQVFRMSRFQHLSHREIADQLNISQKTVENHIGKALSVLRHKLKPYMGMVILLLEQEL
ncbi:RNA polymerase sigma-70 factor [Larkinella arboricola]|uniref:RNA polymerase sigma-70 factor (ECF subfamily) n=1 Tax=Larkinella arboricola TaxID=643671 RepID=A0A327WSF9_LARAB|nr:RNA polymerase sigma-70 factor [Larkinella arboricola]RAJ95642.1 RNA polymerase sigma-70 factor (ECF subfamily) [Larkinella arboricola]